MTSPQCSHMCVNSFCLFDLEKGFNNLKLNGKHQFKMTLETRAINAFTK